MCNRIHQHSYVRTLKIPKHWLGHTKIFGHTKLQRTLAMSTIENYIIMAAQSGRGTENGHIHNSSPKKEKKEKKEKCINYM